MVVLRMSGDMFVDRTNNARVKSLTGSIRVQFQLSDLPEHKELGPTLVLRVLDIVTPITVDPNYRGDVVPVPVPGTLLQRFSPRRHPVVCLPLLRQPMADALLALVELKTALRTRGVEFPFLNDTIMHAPPA